MSKQKKKAGTPSQRDSQGVIAKTNKMPVSTPKTYEKPITFWENTRLQAILIGIFSFLLYANTLTHDFCQDDAIVITDNMFTTRGVSGIKGILNYDTFYGYFKEEGKAQLVAGGRYRPFTLVMFAIEYQIFGKNPFIGHLFNALWYAFTCVVLYLLFLKLLKYREKADSRQLAEGSSQYAVGSIVFFTTLIFAVHPLHTEVVANIKGRDEIMSLLGSLSAVWFSLKYFETKQIKYWIFTAIMFLIGLLSKENAITFVLITPLIYWFFIKTDWMTAFKQTIPFVVSSIVFMAMRVNAIGIQFGGEQRELMNNPYLKLVGNQYIPFEFSEKFATIFYTLGKYIQLLFVPYPLTHDYYPRHIDIMNFSDWRVLLSVAVYGALIWFLLRGWQKRDLISFGIAFFLITLSIVSNIVFPVGTNMAERFMFMPSIGFALVLAIILSKILRGGTLLYGTGIIILLFSIQTIMRNFVWKDNFTIFTTDVKTSVNSAKLQCSAGGAMIEKYANEKDLNLKKAKFDEAIAHLKRALEIHPPFKNPYLLLGNAYFYLEDWNNAIPAYENALKLDANFKDAKSNLALAYRQAGKHQGQVLNNISSAIDLFTKSLELNPNDGETWSNLGTCYGLNNQPLKLIEALTKALALRPSQADATNISIAYRQIGDTAKAVEWEQKAASMK